MTGGETGGWSGGRKKTKDTARKYFTSGLKPKSRRLAANDRETGRREKEREKKRVVGVIGPQQHRSGVNGLI